MDEYKTCTKCGQPKAFADFAKDKYKKSGLTSQCKPCRAGFHKNRRDTDPEYRELLRLQSKANYHKNKVKFQANYRNWARNNKDKRRQIDARYRSNNRKKEALRQSEYRKNNPDMRRNWSKNNPLAQAAIYAKRSFRRRGGRAYFVSLEELAKLYKSSCLYCGAPAEHIDHILPLARGGEHRIGNLTGACAACNLSKGSKFITEWKKGER